MIAYWLMPAEPARRQLAEVIAELAERYGGPRFETHVTLLVSSDDERLASSIVETTARKIQPIELNVAEVEWGDSFTKRLYLQLACPPALSELHNALRKRSLQPNDHSLDPHVSLLYAETAPDKKSFVPPALRRIRFDQLQAIIFQPPITTPVDVASWRTIATTKLGG